MGEGERRREKGEKWKGERDPSLTPPSPTPIEGRKGHNSVLLF